MSNRRRTRRVRLGKPASVDEWLDAIWSRDDYSPDMKLAATVMARHARLDPSSGDFLVEMTPEVEWEAVEAINWWVGGDAQ